MSTIPLIFNERNIKRTVLGGTAAFVSEADLLKRPPAAFSEENFHTAAESIAVLLLNRGGNRYCSRTLEILEACGFKEIVVVHSSGKSYGTEELSRRNPHVKFILPLEDVSCGDMINIGMAEIKAAYALVVWDDIKISAPLLNSRFITGVVQTGRLCTAPVLQSPSLQKLPVRMLPRIEKNSFSAVPYSMESPMPSESVKTVYPFDFIGIYHRQKFMQLGGYDYTFDSPYWQNLDFALRAWLWGEEIAVSSSFVLTYEGNPPLENSTADYMQLAFFLKNCAPVFRSDCAYIPIIRFFDFCRRYPGSPFKASEFFRRARSWVHINRFRFKTDVVKLTREWNIREDGLAAAVRRSEGRMLV